LNIRKAIKSDAEKLVKLVDSVKFDKETSEKNGFIKGIYTAEEYELFMNNVDTFFIAEIDNEIIGFVWLFDEKEYLKEETYGKINDKDYFFVRQIVAKHGTNLNIGNKLYRYVKEKLPKNLYATIYTTPKNTRSLTFHDREGFVHQSDVILNEKILSLVKFEYKNIQNLKIN